MRSTWFKLVAYILHENPYERREIGIKNGGFIKKEFEGFSTYRIHLLLLKYLHPKRPNIATTNSVLKRMQSYGLVKMKKINLKRLRSFNPSLGIIRWWKGKENVWSLTPAGKRYFENIKPELKEWVERNLGFKI